MTTPPAIIFCRIRAGAKTRLIVDGPMVLVRLLALSLSLCMRNSAAEKPVEVCAHHPRSFSWRQPLRGIWLQMEARFVMLTGQASGCTFLVVDVVEEYLLCSK